METETERQTILDREKDRDAKRHRGGRDR